MDQKIDSMVEWSRKESNPCLITGWIGFIAREKWETIGRALLLGAYETKLTNITCPDFLSTIFMGQFMLHFG